MTDRFPVAIIGGGPIGLAAAAQLAKRNKSFVLMEKGESIGHSFMQWKHLRLFSPWRYNIDKAAEALLVAHGGWISPPKDQRPTGLQMVQGYFLPLSNLPKLRPFIKTNSRVLSIHRYGIDKMKTAGRETFPFEVVYEKNGAIHPSYVSAVIDATGTWDSPNPAGASGNRATGEDVLDSHIFYGIPETAERDREIYAGKTVAVVGSGHSAMNSILELDHLKYKAPGTQIIWVLRKHSVASTYGAGTNDALPARAELGTRVRELVENGRVRVYAPFRVHTIDRADNRLCLVGLMGHQNAVIPGIDEIVVNTGARPDFSFLTELRYASDVSLECVPALADLIDPNVHSCGTVRPHGEAELRQPEPNFYIVGSKSYGRAPTFLMATGYEQVRSIVAELSGDWESARKVDLDLPATGVCGIPIG